MFLEILLLTIHFIIIREIEKQTDILKDLHSEIDTLANKIGKLTSTVNAWRMEATIDKLTDRKGVKNENTTPIKSNTKTVVKKENKSKASGITKITKSEKKKLKEDNQVHKNLKLARRNSINNAQNFAQQFSHGGHQITTAHPYLRGTDYTPRYQRPDYRYAGREQQYGMDYRM